MGYACPVCGTPQADGEHLADHLAITAMLHGGRHEAWLDEHVPDWADRERDGLADAAVEHAESVEHETVFEDTTGTADRGRPDVDVGPMAGGSGAPRGLDPEAMEVYERALEMTRRGRAGGESEDGEE